MRGCQCFAWSKFLEDLTLSALSRGAERDKNHGDNDRRDSKSVRHFDVTFSFELPGDVLLGCVDQLESCLTSFIGAKEIVVGEALAGEL